MFFLVCLTDFFFYKMVSNIFLYIYVNCLYGGLNWSKFNLFRSAVKNAVLERTQSQTGELDDTYDDG